VLENKEVEVDPLIGVDAANKCILESFKLYRKEESRLRGW
jgi:hypothetical protein